MGVKIRCASCRKPFEARRSTATFCSATCRQRARRSTEPATAKARPAKATAKTPAKKAPAKKVAAPTKTPVIDKHGLVVAVRTELEQLEKLDTFDGQLALQLARRLANPDESSVVTLAKELRTAMDTVRGPADPAPDPGGAPAEPDDEVTRARRAREEAREAAART